MSKWRGLCLCLAGYQIYWNIFLLASCTTTDVAKMQTIELVYPCPEIPKEWAQETPQQDDDIILYFEIGNSGGRQNPSKPLTWTASK